MRFSGVNKSRINAKMESLCEFRSGIIVNVLPEKIYEGMHSDEHGTTSPLYNSGTAHSATERHVFNLCVEVFCQLYPDVNPHSPFSFQILIAADI